jgi:molybdopterin synthase sulfur carrier subunit
VIRVLLFGRLADLAGWRDRTLADAPASLAALRAILSAENPALGFALSAAGVRAAVDKVLVTGDVALSGGAEVALMPPMSGG